MIPEPPDEYMNEETFYSTVWLPIADFLEAILQTYEVKDGKWVVDYATRQQRRAQAYVKLLLGLFKAVTNYIRLQQKLIGGE